ncbi:MAG: UvrD-helicase domain-containing protein [Anaerolineales bacterium]|nr:UvrD-helicase domain-containing protein [Anaerolineales bacterium]
MTNDKLHPLVQQMDPSPEQQGPVISRGSNLVVTAGAGTGKTRTLVARYLSLLAEGRELRSIVAITFTIKASREMRNRVREEVRRYLERENLEPGERRKWQGIYRELDAARISTIHGLCAEILRTHPAEVGIDPRFEMLDEGAGAVRRSRAVKAALNQAANDRETAFLFSAFGAWSLERMVGGLVEKRLDIAGFQDAEDGDLWAVWKELLIEPLRKFLEDPGVKHGFRALEGIRQAGLLDQAAAAGDALVPHLRDILHHWQAVSQAEQRGDWEEISRHLAPLRQALKQKGRKANWDPAEPKKIISDLQGAYDHYLKEWGDDPLDLALDRQLADRILPALLKTARMAISRYSREKQQLRALDFDDLEWEAVQLLTEHPGVRLGWQKKINALLVDEFQDTNSRQRDLLELLSGSQQNLFIVGDGKQSIYRFRGADVAVFREERDRIHSRGDGFHLATSYRAHAGLLRALNALLAPVLGDEDPEKPYLEPFAPLEPHRADPAPGFSSPYVEFHLTVGRKSRGALDRAAEAAASRIRELIEGQDRSLEGGGDSPAGDFDYGDVAILCRAANSFEAYERALERIGIPFLTISGRGFYDRPEVRDVLNALTALADPGNDLALAGLLRSPGGGLSDIALYRLRKRQKAEGLSSLYSALGEKDLAYLEQEARTAEKVRKLIDDLHHLVGRESVVDVLSAFLEETRYRSALKNAGLTRSVHNLNKLLADAQDSGLVSVQQFLAYVQQLRDVAVREGEAQALSEGAVQIMTVHQAKGLEFPVVVIGDASKRTPAPRGILLDDDFGVVSPFSRDSTGVEEGSPSENLSVSSAAYRMVKQREEDREKAESARLLYVAATRAQEKLLISGCVRGINQDGTFSKPSGWLRMMGKHLDLSSTPVDHLWNGSGVRSMDLETEAGPLLCAVYEPNWQAERRKIFQETGSGEAAPPDEKLLNPVGESAPAEEREPEEDRQIWRVVPRADKPGIPSWVVGQLVHRAFERWLFPESKSRDYFSWAAAELGRMGIYDEDLIQRGASRAAELLSRFRQSELFQEMDAAEDLRTEVPYTLIDDQGEFQSGRIDALYWKDGEGKIVEFKTDRVDDLQSLRKLIAEKEYDLQVEGYQEAASRILGERLAGKLVFLDVNRTVQSLDF